MRMIGLLLALLLVAFLINQQLGSTGDENRGQDYGLEVDPSAPTVPTKPAQVEQFGQDMQKYLDEKAKQRLEAVDEQTQD